MAPLTRPGTVESTETRPDGTRQAHALQRHDHTAYTASQVPSVQHVKHDAEPENGVRWKDAAQEPDHD